MNINENKNLNYQVMRYKEECKRLEEENELLKGKVKEFEGLILGLLNYYYEVYERFPDLQKAMEWAKSYCVQWHKLRENPNDLPEDTYDVLDQAGYKVHYNFFQNVWVNEKDEIDNQVIAWCEIPQFKE